MVVFKIEGWYSAARMLFTMLYNMVFTQICK